MPNSAADPHAALHRGFRWRVPARFNIGDACCTRWADSGRIAIRWRRDDGAAGTLGYAELHHEAGLVAGALAAAGVRRGDRVAIVMPQRPETAIAHMAV